MTMTDANQNRMLSPDEDKFNKSSQDQQNREIMATDTENKQDISGVYMKDSNIHEPVNKDMSLIEEKKVQPSENIISKDNIDENNAIKTHDKNDGVQTKHTTGYESMETDCDVSGGAMQKRRSGIKRKHADSKLQETRTQNPNSDLQGVIDKLNTNDSPIQAVNQLTNAASYTVQWKAGNHGNTSVKGQEVVAEHQLSLGSIDSKNSAPKSILEQTVGKLKLSHATEAQTRTSEGEVESSDVQLQSSAPPDYLKELLERSQTNRRKGFVPKRNPQGKKQRTDLPKSIPVSKSVNKESHKVNDQLVNVIAGSSSHGPTVKHSNEDGYVINRSSLRKLAPKPNGMDTGGLTVAIGPTTPPTGLIIPPQVVPNKKLISPPFVSSKITSPPAASPRIISPTASIPQLFLPQPIIQKVNISSHQASAPSRSPKTISVNTKLNSPTTSHWLSNQQDKPLDLCTKSASGSEASSPPLSPAENLHNENEPMDLSTDKPKPPKIEHQPREQLPSASGFWKTPPRVAMIHPNKHAVSSSPIEADTPSDKVAANSPGLDNRNVPYGFIMSPEMMKGMVQMGGLSHPYSRTSQYIADGFPEGAILLPGAGPHYRLPRRIALQHDEPPTPERPYMCDQCGATFKRNKSLKQHVRVHLDQVNEPQDHTSSNQQDQSKLPLEIKPHACIVCQRKFSHHEQLKRHMRIHREDKAFVCEQSNCGKKFTDSSQLRLHMRTHSDHKPFPCPFCTLRFKYSGDVKRHVRIHTGEKPYVCGYCKMRFTQSNTLKQHERTHTGERPYHCHKCGMTFTQSGSLKYHLAHRHPPDVKTVIIDSNSQTMTSQSPMVQVMNPVMNISQHGMSLK